MRAWHTLNKEELVQILETSEHGLQKQESAKRLAEYGRNELTFDVDSLWKKIIEPFKTIFVAVLAVAAVISVFKGEILGSYIITAVLIVNALIFYVQQYMTARVLRALKRTAEQAVTVIRGGAHVEIPIQELVPGDVLLLSEGQQVPADVRVLHDDNVQVDESALTGESLPLEKHASVLPDETPLYGRHNMMYRGTYIVSGAATVLVVETGMQTEFGAIAHLAAGREVKSPVQQKIDNTVAILIKATAVISFTVLILSLLRGIDFSYAMIFAMTVAVSMVPEGLPIALTVTIVFGMRRMAKKKALVRSFRAIEDIGLITTIATDKTGTLTKNKLSVVDVWQYDSAHPALPVLAHAIGDHANAIDPLDQAFAQYVRDKKHKNHGLLITTYPFEQSIRMSGAAWATKKGTEKLLISVKGAPEHILRMSKLTKAAHHEAESKLHLFASEGYRVIAVATLEVAKAPEKLEDVLSQKLTFVGFIACADELRPEAKGAIKAAHKAGITVRLITGDHYETAFNIARTLDIAESRSQVIAGHDLPEDDDKLAEIVQTKTVFARVLPDDKFRILKALQVTEIAAMTGDGVNDVPALSSAHVGVAMGSGSDIAKDASDMVLLDNNFATVVRGVEEGRVVYNNIRRMLFYLLSANLGAVSMLVMALLVGLPLPLTAVMVLWMNLVTDTALVIPLGLEHPEGDEMQHKPRKPKEPLLTRMYVVRILLVAVVMSTSTLIAYNYFLGTQSLAYAQTVAFMVLISLHWANALNARSGRQSIFRRARVINESMVIGLTVAIFAQSLVMFGPLGSLFNIQPVAIVHLAVPMLCAIFTLIVVIEAHKWIVRYRKPLTK
jgi:P-type Ca2+ transporter type 2C